jgi:hypothetical protein
VLFSEPSESLVEPTGPPARVNWTKTGERDAKFVRAYERIVELKGKSFTGRQVTTHFLMFGIAPMQRRSVLPRLGVQRGARPD